MESAFWHQKWDRGDIGFHQPETNPLLAAHFDKLALPGGSRIFVPLCGKTLDLAWLLASGYRVVGAELSEIAVIQLFEQLGLEPQITLRDNLIHYHARHIDILVGDIFDVTPQTLGTVQAVYDRAALIALPTAMRERYTAHLVDLTQAAPQLLLTYEYNQQRMDGPPFSITQQHIRQYYADIYQVTSVAREPVVGQLMDKVDAISAAWLLARPTP